VGVGAFNVSYIGSVHFSFAFIGFYGLLVYELMHSWIDAVLIRSGAFGSNSASPRLLHKCRVGICCLALLGCVAGTFIVLSGDLVSGAICELLVFSMQMLYFWTWLCCARAGDAKEVLSCHA
ncbi:unnamed protein product, partial [Polarella glacialis]